MNTSPYTRLFERAVAFVLLAEGGYVNDPNDPGGATCYGISQRAYPDVDIASLTEDQAKAIYYGDYWQRCQCGQLPPAVACALFDGAVNLGRSASVKCLQRALARLQGEAITVDGIMGPQTLAGITAVPETALLPAMLAYRGEHYHKVVLRTRSHHRFIYGWLRRVFELQQFIERDLKIWH